MITIVTGLPRSGTSLAMQLLEAAGIPPFTDGCRSADASNPQGYYEAEIVKTLPQDSAWLEEAEGRAVKVIHLLLPNLPLGRNYRVLVMERDLGAVLRSQQLMLERLGRAGAALPEERLRQVYGAQLAQMEGIDLGSDHLVFNESSWGIPGIYLHDWPDRYIHTNFDSAAMIDPTKLKRAAFIAALQGWYLASFDADDVEPVLLLLRANDSDAVATVSAVSV